MKHLDLYGLASGVEGGTSILEALSESSIERLTHISLGLNEEWFTDDCNGQLLADFIGRQQCLRTLRLRRNEFSSEASDEILHHLVESPALQTIQDVNLFYSANFDSDVSVQALATLLANAPALKVINIGHQQGTRKVNVEVKYATAVDEESGIEATEGTVTITDRADESTICVVPTNKRSNQEVKIKQ